VFTCHPRNIMSALLDNDRDRNTNKCPFKAVFKTFMCLTCMVQVNCCPCGHDGHFFLNDIGVFRVPRGRHVMPDSDALPYIRDDLPYDGYYVNPRVTSLFDFGTDVQTGQYVDCSGIKSTQILDDAVLRRYACYPGKSYVCILVNKYRSTKYPAWDAELERLVETNGRDQVLSDREGSLYFANRAICEAIANSERQTVHDPSILVYHNFSSDELKVHVRNDICARGRDFVGMSLANQVICDCGEVFRLTGVHCAELGEHKKYTSSAMPQYELNSNVCISRHNEARWVWRTINEYECAQFLVRTSLDFLSHRGHTVTLRIIDPKFGGYIKYFISENHNLEGVRDVFRSIYKTLGIY